MARVRVSVPATINSFGAGLNATALALRLYQTVELAEVDTGFSVEVRPVRPAAEMAAIRAISLEIVGAVCRVTHSTPSGLRVTISQENLTGLGLGLNAGLPLGCAVAVNALCGGPLGRDELLRLVLDAGCEPAPAIASLRGNMAVAAEGSPAALHAVIAPASQEVIVIAPPAGESHPAEQDGERAAGEPAITGLLIEGLRTGNFELLGRLAAHMLEVRKPRRELLQSSQAAMLAGAAAVFVHERDLSAVIFARSKHDKIVEAVTETYAGASAWIVPVETRGISIDAVDVSASASKLPIPAGRRSPQPE